MTLENISTVMPTVDVDVNGLTRHVAPVGNELKFTFQDGLSLTVAIRNTGTDGQVEDLMYVGTYAMRGEPMTGGHKFASVRHLTEGLGIVLSNLERQGSRLVGTA